MRILVCGDSFSVTDPDYPGLHWTEKILNFSPDFEVANLSYGGCSNAMINLQLLQGLNLNPDFVIISFTNEHRYELDNNINAIPTDLTPMGIATYQKTRYTTNVYTQDKEIARWMSSKCSDNFEKIKNYFYISFCIQTLKQRNIPFAFSLGGFEYKQDYTALINANYMYNFIKDYTDYELKTNLWFYHGGNSRPYFHVSSNEVQTLYANECINRITNIKKELTC
ncbi:hypothetical protein UFOVP1146_78 [uncultured Caudovirales phage]|uniref:Uncharacterized protein n=1 Tax=uncultured Caudovirales phage TaxID=2100421 RepID=A0A6J5QSF7_9CAUD|nr:hypothetical protein UFOVP812_411 [uncultured Caudovirales phage]CAB4165617.1 hypothetical protein UFOVP818_153 [uncultured Caudovirales phage]CAB4186732.1 hypothetical protein UFOVP1146_78 [uncultured Caudovirales phage]CAB4220816.1 hypothetical protein UFOVP1638_66 [uncultured Caudovirales phage]